MRSLYFAGQLTVVVREGVRVEIAGLVGEVVGVVLGVAGVGGVLGQLAVFYRFGHVYY